MRSIKLTCEQRRVLLAMRDLYLRNMGALVRRRQQLSAELQVGNHVIKAGHWRRM